MPLPAQIQLSNTFGQWINTTNQIITATGNSSEYILVAQNATPQTSTGNVSVNGTITVVNLTSNGVITGNGISLTSLNASALATGTIPLARLSSANTAANGVVDTATQSFAGDKTFTNNVAVSGTITGNNLSLTNSLLEKYSSTLTYTVTVINKTAAHRYFGTGSGHGYVINGVESPYLSLLPGKTYRFDQADASNGGHPLRFYVDEDKSKQYNTDITTSGTAGQSGAYTEIAVTANTPATLHYQCSSHAKMGNQIQVEGSRAFDLILAYGNVTANGVLTVSNAASLGNTTVTGFVNVSSNLSIGANVTANTTTVFVGNSSINTAITAGTITLSGVTVGTNASALSTGTVPLAQLTSANTTANGVVDTTTQTFAGVKTFQNGASFTGAATFSNTISVTGTATMNGTINANNKLTLNTTNGRFVLPVGADKWAT